MAALLGTGSLALFNLIEQLLLNTAWSYGYCGSSSAMGQKDSGWLRKKSAALGSNFQAEEV